MLMELIPVRALPGFNPRAPGGARSKLPMLIRSFGTVSIHAPPEGRDTPRLGIPSACSMFQSTRPRRGAIGVGKRIVDAITCFNPRAPGGGAIPVRHGLWFKMRVSIHAPPEGRDTHTCCGNSCS